VWLRKGDFQVTFGELKLHFSRQIRNGLAKYSPVTDTYLDLRALWVRSRRAASKTFVRIPMREGHCRIVFIQFMAWLLN
jgi:hypothetical protein